MSKATYYQTDFKPDYQRKPYVYYKVFQQKVSQLSRQKNRINKTQINIEKLKHQLELINQEIDDQGLQFDNSNIFLRYATIQQLAQKKKSASDCCLHCGQEMKKTVQCQFCAQLYCKNCCWRKRVIPFQQHADFRLCCEQCHQKYIKHFNNQQFYKQKAIYLAAIDELERKYDKTKAKYEKKQNQVKEYKQQKRAIKIKQGNLKKALLQQQKAIKILAQEYERAIQNKAIQIKLQQDKQKNQNRQLQLQKQRFEQQRKIQQQRRAKQLQKQQQRILQNSRKRQEQLAARQEEILRQKQRLEKQRKEIADSKIKKIQEQLKVQTIKQKKQVVIEEEKQKDEVTKPQQINDKNSTKQSVQKQKQVQIKIEEPRRVIFNQQLDFDSILQDALSKKQFQSIKQSMKVQQKKQIKTEEKKNQVTLKDLLKQIKENKKFQEVKVQKQVKSTERKQQNDSKSQKSKNSQSQNQSQDVNEAPKLTMNLIKKMSINDLLSVKISVNPGSSPQQKRPRKSSHPEIKVEAQQNSTTTQNQKMYQSLLQPYLPLPQSSLVGLALPTQIDRQSTQKQQILRRSIQSVHEQEQDEQEKENSKLALLMRQSLLSSSNKVSISAVQKQPEYNDEQQQTTLGQPQKCTCEIM